MGFEGSSSWEALVGEGFYIRLFRLEVGCGFVVTASSPLDHDHTLEEAEKSALDT